VYALTTDEFARVEKWLYSIPRIEIAVETLTLEIERLNTKAVTPPTWMSTPNGGMPTGGTSCSRQENWVEFLDEYPVRKNELLDKIEDRQKQLKCYEKVMNILRAEDSRYTQLVWNKYIKKVTPDRIIWEEHLFISKSSFYRMRSYIVESFLECLPGQFGK
jgi:hypothetical protein